MNVDYVKDYVNNALQRRIGSEAVKDMCYLLPTQNLLIDEYCYMLSALHHARSLQELSLLFCCTCVRSFVQKNKRGMESNVSVGTTTFVVSSWTVVCHLL